MKHEKIANLDCITNKIKITAETKEIIENHENNFQFIFSVISPEKEPVLDLLSVYNLNVYLQQRQSTNQISDFEKDLLKIVVFCQKKRIDYLQFNIN